MTIIEVMIRRIFLLTASAALMFAADKPDFSGHWVVDVSKSDFGMMPPPEKMERVVEHKDPDFKMKSTQVGARGEQTSEVKYTTDGKEATIQMRNREAKVVAKWDGNKLVVTTKSEFNGTTLSQTETWMLSGDGKTLNTENQIKAPQGEFTVKLVFTKGS